MLNKNLNNEDNKIDKVYLDFPVIANFQWSTGEFLFAERWPMKISWSNGYVCKWSIWVTNLGTNHGEVLPNYFLPRPMTYPSWRGISLPRQNYESCSIFFMVNYLQTTQHRANLNLPKKLMQTSWFQTNFAVYLWTLVSLWKWFSKLWRPWFFCKAYLAAHMRSFFWNTSVHANLNFRFLIGL